MLEVLDWQRATDPSAIVHRALSALRQGELVVFPTETVYGLAAFVQSPEAVERLCRDKGRPLEKSLTLAIAGWSELTRWLPGLSALGQRLARKSWPGPLTLVSGAGVEQGLFKNLDKSVKKRISPAGTLGLRVPAHPAILEVLRQLEGALVLTSANSSGLPPATTAEAVGQDLGNDVALIIDGGPALIGQPSTVVSVDGDQYQILRAGALTAEEIEQRTHRTIVFVCTGNTCRSPMAAGFCKKQWADRLGCEAASLPDRGIHVLSAGLAAMMGGGAAPEAIAVAREHGVDLSSHSTRVLTRDLVETADRIIGMTYAHVLAARMRYPEAAGRMVLFSPDGDDIPDPIGCDVEVYRACARQLAQILEKTLPDLVV